MMRVVVIGSGNLAESSLRALCESGVEVVQLYGRNAARVAHLGAMCNLPYTSRAEQLAEAELYLLALSDRAIGDVAAQLPIPSGALVAHTAGSVSIDVLPYAHRGSLYPFQSFTAGRRVDFKKIPIFVEASDRESLEQLRRLAEQLSERVYPASREQRRQIHLSGVFACNLVNALYGVGAEVVGEASLCDFSGNRVAPFDLLKPLIGETAAKALDSSNPAEVQTGPAVRGDRAVWESHLGMLEAYPEEELKQIYDLISRRIWKISKRR